MTRQISVDVPCLRVPSPVLARSCEWPGSGGAVADHPDCGGAEQHREGEQPAALDELEGPEAAGRLVGEVLDIALLCEPLLNGGVHPGYTQWAIYQPGTRYWHFQLIEGGWLLALSLLLIAATIWIVRRRAA